MERTEIINFEPLQYIVEGNMVVVLGREHQKVKRTGRELKQDWVQIYTVEKLFDYKNGRICKFRSSN